METPSVESILAGDRRSLAKAITLIESRNPDHRRQSVELLEELLPHTGNSRRIAVSGVPGAGKSTFIESFGLGLVAEGRKVAVLAIDPSSPKSGGSLLGDKTRMAKLSQAHGAFVRPSPTSGALGGVGRRTRESILLCEAAGYDTVLVETVGVGQSEIAASMLVDLFLVLMLPNAGDELQGIKKGILEVADILVVNKADGEQRTQAQTAAEQYKNALALTSSDGRWKPRVLTASALERIGLTEVAKSINDFFTTAKKDGSFNAKRRRQQVSSIWSFLVEGLEERLRSSAALAKELNLLEEKVGSGEMIPERAATSLMDSLGLKLEV